jgi:outer membrane lipoprotein SlyB
MFDPARAPAQREGNAMRTRTTILATVLVTQALLVPAYGAGCLKGAVVGGVAGHVAGHHAIMGAIAGCAVGHHMAVKHRREEELRRHQQMAPHG